LWWLSGPGGTNLIDTNLIDAADFSAMPISAVNPGPLYEAGHELMFCPNSQTDHAYCLIHIKTNCPYLPTLNGGTIASNRHRIRAQVK